jgi:predicted RecB family nuclease
MTAKITRDVVESRLRCRYKAHLKLAGEQGAPSDYEALLAEARDEVRRKATTRIEEKCGAGEVARNVPLTIAVLRQGPPFVLDAVLEDDTLSLRFDGLKKVPGPSDLGDFHYAPVLFHEGRGVGAVQKHLLELYGLLLSRVQGRLPELGLLFHGREGKATRVRLAPGVRKAEQLLRELKEVADPATAPTRLLLNDHCQVCEFRLRCHEQAVREDNLSLLRAMSEKEIKGLARKGILTLTQLAHTFRPRRKGKRQAKKTHKRYHALQTLAARDKKVYVFGTPEVPDSPVRVYLDVEGDPEEGYVYLIGVIVVKDGAEEKHSFWADEKDQEGLIFEQFLAEVGRHEEFSLFCYGGYEKTFLKRMRKTAKRKKPVDQALGALVNTLSLVYAHAYFPCYSNGLKEVAAWLGCSWSEPDASGLQSVVWRKRWERTRAEEWRQKPIRYNLEDCAALKRVTEFIRGVGASAPPVSQAVPAGEGPPVARVQELDRLANDRKWGEVNFFHPDFRFVNECAYFDYQRGRVYARTSRLLKENQGRRAKGRRRKLPVSKKVTAVGSRRPACGSEGVAPQGKGAGRGQPRVKRAYDLVMTAGGIKRRVIESRSSLHRCPECGHAFVPEQHQRLDKHFHGLKSWAMYLHVAHRLSFEQISVMLEEFFGLRVPDSDVYMLKSLTARYYRHTYRSLLKKILAGNLLHIDETEVKFKTGKGYVWVFTNLEEVVYLYKPSREGEFLKGMLTDFKGVLVSDFYSAYDGIDCPQQKCLIHLIRDMNQELLNNPFDEELQSITRPFGALLRAVVATVDEHGLKRRHLQRHKRDVEGFFRGLAGATYRSEAAEALRHCLSRYQGKLFTFLDHDGVPWNNNNAENAIKRFAYYRQETAWLLKEPGLKDYLVLLSLYQTCRYKGVSFLKFLRSGQRDIDRFCEGKGRKRRAFSVELYPKGFTPPSLASIRKAKPPAPEEPQPSNAVAEDGVAGAEVASPEGDRP